MFSPRVKPEHIEQEENELGDYIGKEGVFALQ